MFDCCLINVKKSNFILKKNIIGMIDLGYF